MDLWKLSTIEQGRSVATGVVSSVELVDAHIAQIGSVNGRPNAKTPVLKTAADRCRDHVCLDVAEVIEDAFGTVEPIDPAW